LPVVRFLGASIFQKLTIFYCKAALPPSSGSHII